MRALYNNSINSADSFCTNMAFNSFITTKFKVKSIFKRKLCHKLETVYHDDSILFGPSWINCCVEEEITSNSPNKFVPGNHIMHHFRKYAQLTPYELYIWSSPVTHTPLACLPNSSSSPWVHEQNLNSNLEAPPFTHPQTQQLINCSLFVFLLPSLVSFSQHIDHNTVQQLQSESIGLSLGQNIQKHTIHLNEGNATWSKGW